MPEGYFDHAAAAPLLPEARQAMLTFLNEDFGSPSSMHRFGTRPRAALDDARTQVAALINSRPDDIVFTASASESNNLAIKGFALAHRDKGMHIVASATEHVSVLEALKSLCVLGLEYDLVPVEPDGTVHPDKLAAAIKTETVLVSVMHANYEVGTIQNIKELAALARRYRVPFHSDGTAAVGRIPVDVADLGVDAYTFPAMSVYGPKGAAALYLKRGTRIQSLIEGGFQEKNRRAGTEDVAAIAGFGAAAAVTKAKLPEWSATMTKLAQRIFKELPGKLDHVLFTGPVPPETGPESAKDSVASRAKRIPGHVSVVVEFVEGEAMLLFLDDGGIAAASGSSCSAKTLKASHVLLAMGLPHTKAQSSLVLTMGKDTTDADVTLFLEKLPPIAARLREISPLYAKFKKGEDPYAVKPGETCEDEHQAEHE
ncbi:cysteine desulfurase [candidate division WOR-3 bacterium]|nr:cysteine desulfurase [candidate division WOR-3 bacterium]